MSLTPSASACMECFENTDSLLQKLYNLFGEPVQKGEAWLRSHAKDMWRVSDAGVEIRDQLQQLLLLHLTGEWRVESSQRNHPLTHQPALADEVQGPCLYWPA